MTCAPFANFVEWKIWKRESAKRKLQSYYSRNVYQMKDLRFWSRGLKRIQVWVIEKNYNCQCTCTLQLYKYCQKLWSPFGRAVVPKLFSTKKLPAFPCCDCLWHFDLDELSFLLASFRIKGRKYLSFGFIFRISEATLMLLPCWWRTELTSVKIKIISSLRRFLQGQNCWRYLALIPLSSSAKRETEVKLGPSL